MGWLVFFAGLIAWSTCPSIDAKGAEGARAMALVWFAWALVVVAMIAGLVLVTVLP